MNEREKFGERMRLAMREAGGVSKAVLAKDVATSETTAGNWVNGKVHPEEVKAVLAIRVSKRLGVRVEWLVLNDGPMYAPGAQVKPTATEAATLRARLDSILATQMAMAKVLATIPNAGATLVAELARLPEDVGGEPAVAVAAIARRELASLENERGPHRPPEDHEPTVRKRAR